MNFEIDTESGKENYAQKGMIVSSDFYLNFEF